LKEFFEQVQQLSQDQREYHLVLKKWNYKTYIPLNPDQYISGLQGKLGSDIEKISMQRHIVMPHGDSFLKHQL
jgi:hypothetical protein